MLEHKRCFCNLSDISGLGLTIFFRPRPDSIWPRPRPRPHSSLTSLTSLLRHRWRTHLEQCSWERWWPRRSALLERSSCTTAKNTPCHQRSANTKHKSKTT